MNYTHREPVIWNFQHIGDVARFGHRDWRCSAHPDAERFPTREAAINYLKHRSKST